MSLRVCTEPGCPVLVPKGARAGRCVTHQRAVAARRGTREDQGYGRQHKQVRTDLIPQWIGRPCPDCGDLMTDPTQMVADHSTPLSVNRNSTADRMHCRKCSNRQGGTISRKPQP